MERHTLSTQRTGTWRDVLFLAAILLVTACEGGNEPTAPITPPVPPTTPVATLAGKVVSFAGDQPIAGATVSIGSVTATTGADGRFQLSGHTPGPATLRGIAAGFEDFEAEITVPSGSVTQDISLKRVELFEFGASHSTFRPPSRARGASSLPSAARTLGGSHQPEDGRSSL